MKKNFKYILGLLFVGSLVACKKDLDINTNPNSATSGTPSLVLPQAIVSMGAKVVSYNNSLAGGQVSGYFANSAGVSGWGAIISYDYQTSSAQNLWNDTYDALQDVQYVLNKTEGDAEATDYNAAAKVMKAYGFAMLVDVYNDAPYSEAFKGNEKLQPKYDDAKVIYKNIADLLDQAIVTFKTLPSASKTFQNVDPLFKGNILNWARLANTLKLKLVIKGKDKGVSFSNTTFDATVGFLTDDAMVNPGYAKIDGKQNPMWNSWAYNSAGTAVGSASQYVPTPWILSFYDGSRILDGTRAALVYKNGLTTTKNQLGYLPTSAETNSRNFSGLTPSNWFLGANNGSLDNVGILKAPDAGQPIMLAAESHFLQAEAIVRGIITGTAKTSFENGVKSAYKYLVKNKSNASTKTDLEITTFLTTYKTDNATNALVNFDLATTDAQKTEAIITQKYIAFNMLFGHEAFNEYKRTGYPVMNLISTAKNANFISVASQSTAPDKLPTRITYPESEFKYNQANVPTINKYSSKIFWAK